MASAAATPDKKGDGGGGGGSTPRPAPAPLRGAAALQAEIFAGAMPAAAAAPAAASASVARDVSMQPVMPLSPEGVHNYSDLVRYLDRVAFHPRVDSTWIQHNREIVAFLAGVSSAREGILFGRRVDPKDQEKDWTYHAARAIESARLDAKASNLEQVIIEYAPNEVGDATLAALRALHVQKPELGRYNLLAFIHVGVTNPRNVLAGVFRSLVEAMVQERTCQRGQAAGKRLDYAKRRQRGLLKQLADGCGGLSLESNDCPSTLSR